MAESPSSTSEKPPIENLGLGLLITDSTPLDPINPATQISEVQHTESSANDPVGNRDSPTEVMPEAVDSIAVLDEDVELRNAIERDLCQLTIQQAEIEGARDRSEAVDGDEGNDLGTVRKSDEDEEDTEGKDSASVEDENENDNEGGDEDNHGTIKFGDGVNKLERFNQTNNGRRSNYPMRPDAEDCTFYMKFGSCKFGLNCKFNHPPRRKNQGVKERANHREENSERAGQTECKYYLTPGGCKYGKDCKYSHGSDRNSTPQIPEFNFLGLPIRMGEKECPYYMRTGSCKYGSNCRFHHPDPVAVVGGDSPSGHGNGASLPSQHVPSSSTTSWSSPRAFNDSSPFVPVIFPPPQGAPTTNQDWNRFQAETYPTSERSLPTPPAFAINNLPTEINFPIHHQHDIPVDEYPERPGEPECNFFLKTGDCKFKSNCRFHHPKSRTSKPKANSSSYALNDKGLPLRPDQPICTHYHRYGICKYGPACKYDHPANFAINVTPFDQSPFDYPLPPTPFDQPPFGNTKLMRKGN